MKKLWNYIIGYPKAVAFIAALLVLAVTLSYLVPSLKQPIYLLAVLGIVTVIAFTLHRAAGVVAAVASVIVSVYVGVTYYNSLQPNVAYANLFKALEEQNVDGALAYMPGAGARSSYFAQVMGLDQKTTVAVERKGRQLVCQQSDTSTLIDASVNAGMLALAGNIRTVSATLETMLDSAGIPVPGRQRAQLTAKVDTVAIDVSDDEPEEIAIPKGYSAKVDVLDAHYTCAKNQTIGTLHVIVTHDPGETDWVDADGYRAAAFKIRRVNPGAYVDSMANMFATLCSVNHNQWRQLSMGTNLYVDGSAETATSLRFIVNDRWNAFRDNEGTLRVRVTYLPLAVRA